MPKYYSIFMKKVVKVGWVIFCAGVLALYFLACLTPYIPTSSFNYLSLFSLAFPYLLLGALFCIITLFFIKKGAAAILLVLVFLIGFKNIHNTFAFNTGNWKMQRDSTTLRVMTWNVAAFINTWPPDSPQAQPRLAMYEVIKKYNPDILCLQEFRDIQGPHYISVKAEVLKMYPYAYLSNDSVSPVLNTPNIGYSGSAIFSRLPLADSGRVNLRHIVMNENLIYSDIVYHKKRLRLFTGHLASLNLYIDTLLEPPSNLNIYEKTLKRKHKIEYRFREGEAWHEKQVNIIKAQFAKSPYPLIYCGDNNATPASYTYNLLKGGLQDAFLSKGFGLGGTFYGIAPTLRIDVCLAGPQLQVLQCTVPQDKLSDHYPVVTDLQWK